MKVNTRLSIVEVLIMAVVLGIVARTMVPQFAEAGVEKKISRLVDCLEVMRANIDLYRAHHRNCLPPCDSFKSFKTAMTKQVGRYGPYVRAIPTNPFNRLRTVRFDGKAAGCGKAGWRFDSKTGLFQADHDAAYSAL